MLVPRTSRAPSGGFDGDGHAVLSDADHLYFERVAVDCLDLLGPGMELTGLALDQEGEITLRLSYRLGTTDWTSEGHGPTVIAAHAALREQLVLDRIRVGVRALTTLAR